MNNEKIAVQSKSNGSVSLTDPRTRIGRTWSHPDQIIYLTKEEIEMMASVPGGMYIFKNYLTIKDRAFAEELFKETLEPEYFYDKKTVKALLEQGTSDQLADALSFGGPGVVELIKDTAIEMNLYNRDKRKLISDAAGVDLDFIINAKEDIEREEREKAAAAASNGSAATAEKSAPTRKSTAVFGEENKSAPANNGRKSEHQFVVPDSIKK